MKPFILIQVLRGLAAIMVVLHHAMTPADGIMVTQDGIHFGAAGVDIFFVISGFIIYIASSHKEQTAGNFLLRRAARIFPPYWVATIILVATHVVLGMQRDLVLSPEHALLSFMLVPHESPSVSGSAYPLLIPGWTLQFEIFFYCLFAAAIYLARKAKVEFLTIVILSFVAFGYFVNSITKTGIGFLIATYTSPLLLEFLAGVLIGVIANKRPRLMPAQFIILMFFGFAMLVGSDWTELPRVIEWGIPAVIIVFGTVAGEPVMRQIKVPALLVLFGDASYSIYLTHIITLGFVRGAFRAVFKTGDWWVPLFIVTCVAASIVGGVVFYHLVESPLVKRFTAWFSPTRKETASSPQRI